MMDRVSEKKRLRAEKKRQRDGLAAEARRDYSARICDFLWQSPYIQEASRVCCYAAIGSEVELTPLLERLFAAGKRLAFPRVLGESEMEFYEVASMAELAEGSFHVPEPVDDGREPVDWKGAPVLVPGVAFDVDGARMGYGKGYYDHYFARHPEQVKIGVAFACQLASGLAAYSDDWDMTMDILQTEENCYEAVDAMDYETLVAHISGSRRFGRAAGVTCSAAVLKLLGNPERELSFVHIAGTNGKGSVAAFLSSICQEAGIRAGLFTSPHLHDFTERIRIGDTQIPKERVLTFGRVVWKLNHRLMASSGINLTMFDYCLAIALLYYKEMQVELVILETGMGGRLDSTNCIPAPLVSVITGIGLEHTQYLGESVEQIAAEKAGILKPGTQAVLMEQSGEALHVLRTRCEQLEIPYVLSGAVDKHGYYANAYYQIGMIGSYQRKNAAAAIEAAFALNKKGFEIPISAVSSGISKSRWQGRMEIISEHPWVLLDGAHNVHGMRALIESLRELGLEQLTFFMGVMAEKDYEAMADLLLPLAKTVYTLTPASERALPAETLCTYIRGEGIPSEAVDCTQAAEIIRGMDAEARCVVCGSLYLIGEMRERLDTAYT